MMRKRMPIDRLRQDIEIPDIVWERANLAFQQIQAEGAQMTMKDERKRNISGMNGVGKNESEKRGIGKRGHGRWKAAWIPAAAALVLGSSVCAAAYMQWSRGLETNLQATEQQKHMLEEQRITTLLHDSATEKGITVTAMQTIIDSRFAYLAFQVEGYQVEEGVQPDFEYMNIEVGGNRDGDLLMGHFFNGLRLDENGKFTYVDGSPAKENASGGIIGKYMDENGIMEYTMLLAKTDEPGYFAGKPIHLEFCNLGTVDKAAFTPDINATWTFDFILQGSDKVRACSLSEKLGDSGATVVAAEISPISLYVAYDMPLRMKAIDGVNEYGQAIQSTTFVEAPRLTGVRLKDGTLLTGIAHGGSEGYMGGDESLYQVAFATDSIIDPEQVDALLFVKSEPEGQNALTEENLYIVPIQ